MHSYDSTIKEKAIRLRLSGKSYSEIIKETGIRSKSTLGVWFRDLVITPEANIALKKNIDLATKRKLLKFNQDRTARIRIENLEAVTNGSVEIGELSKRELLILGAALYWGEGTKSEREKGYNSLSLANSDPKLIITYIKFLREVLKVPEKKILCHVHIYPEMNAEEVKKFWSNCTGIKLEQFTVSYQVSRAGRGKRKTLTYGTINVRVHNRLLFYRVKGLIAGLANSIS